MAHMITLRFLHICFFLFFGFFYNAEGCLHSELKALQRFKASLNDSAEKLMSWEGNECCTWIGVHCDEIALGGHVTKLDLSGLQLSTVSNHIDSSLFELKTLKYLDLSDNYFGGIPIPQGLGSLTNLTYLSLSAARFSGEIPPHLGNLSSLVYLNLGYLWPMSPPSPISFEVSSLPSDDYDFDSRDSEIPRLQWLSNLSSLKFLSMSSIQINDISWGSIIGSLSHLTHLELSRCHLPGSTIPLSLLNLSSLAYLNLSRNAFVGIPAWIANMSKLTSLDLSLNSLNGSIPDSLTEHRYLAKLDLSVNKIADGIPKTIGNLTSLKYLDLSANKLTGCIPPSLGYIYTYSGSLSYLGLRGNELEGNIPASLGLLTNLTYIDLGSNQLSGAIPSSIGNLSALSVLQLDGNQLSGGLPQSFSKLSSLTYLDASDNQLNGSIPSTLSSSLEELIMLGNNMMFGTITETLFQNNSNMRRLELDGRFNIKISSTWIPPFQMEDIKLSGCTIGGPIPSWISTQYRLRALDLSGSELVGDIPSWLWDFSSGLCSLNLSDNHLEGALAPTGKYKWLNFMPEDGTFCDRLLDLSKNELSGNLLADIDIHFKGLSHISLADNKFEGPIPASIGYLGDLRILDISRNRLSGNVPASLGNMLYLQVLNLGNNHLDGEIDANVTNLSFLQIFNMANNHLKGEIPKELGKMEMLLSLRLGNNNLQGHLPQSLRNLSSLQVLDVGENNLTGNIPDWIADFSTLQVLVMRSNKFRGKLPPQIGQMPQIQILDLSSNLLSGSIPDTYNFSAMGQEKQNVSKLGETREFGETLYYVDGIDLDVKGLHLHYEYILSSLTCIDLSNNKLVGHLPPVIESLKGLMFLNLSKNNLSGPIPNGVGNLGQLESLDLSVNNISGQIPFELGRLYYLAFLNLSYNSLSGKIPWPGGQMATFQNSSYLGNPNLSGCPLERKCSLPQSRPAPAPAPPASMDVEEETEEEFPWYEMSFGLSVGTGFSAVVTVLALHVRWRIKCFQLMDNAIQSLFSKLFNW